MPAYSMMLKFKSHGVLKNHRKCRRLKLPGQPYCTYCRFLCPLQAIFAQFILPRQAMNAPNTIQVSDHVAHVCKYVQNGGGCIQHHSSQSLSIPPRPLIQRPTTHATMLAPLAQKDHFVQIHQLRPHRHSLLQQRRHGMFFLPW